MLNRTKRGLQKRCTERALEAQRLLGQGQAAEGLARYADAVDIAARLAEADPGDPRPLAQHAAMLCSAGSLYAQAGDDVSALRSLSAGEVIYRDLGDRWKLDFRRQLADVKAREIVAEIGLGLGASAVLDADEAVTRYRELFAGNGTDELALALASALVYNAEALTRYGDPDLIAASAGHAMRLSVARTHAPGFAAGRVHDQAARFWERRQAEGDGVTLARALAAAAGVLGPERVPGDLAANLTRPAGDGVLMVPSDRCPPQLATGYAARLADIAIDVLPAAPHEGLRVGLEAHYLFTIGLPFTEPVLSQFASWAIPWARLLFELSRVLAATRDPAWSFALALNLVRRHEWIIVRLLPLARGAPRAATGPLPGGDGRSLIDLLRDCLALDADLLTRNQDYADAHKLRQLAASITG